MCAIQGCEEVGQREKTHVGLGPENEDFSDHSEQLLCIRVRARQPPRSATGQIILSLSKITEAQSAAAWKGK